MKYLVEWRKCPFCDGFVKRIRNCEQVEFRCSGCNAIMIFKTTDANKATKLFNRRVGDNER